MVLARIWEARADLDRASYHAEEMLALTTGIPEATWRALALETGARIAALRGASVLAMGYIEKALTLVASSRIPVAAWRVHASATIFLCRA